MLCYGQVIVPGQQRKESASQMQSEISILTEEKPGDVLEFLHLKPRKIKEQN